MKNIKSWLKKDYNWVWILFCLFFLCSAVVDFVNTGRQVDVIVVGTWKISYVIMWILFLSANARADFWRNAFTETSDSYLLFLKESTDKLVELQNRINEVVKIASTQDDPKV